MIRTAERAGLLVLPPPPAQSLNDLVRETGLSRATLAEMLRELINERLVRPVGQETYEIQHDRLAAAVIEGMKDSDREAKAAREFLAAKMPAFERTMVFLAPGELVYLYRHRRNIHPTERELGLLLASMLYNVQIGNRNSSPGAYWLGKSSPQDLLHFAGLAGDRVPKIREICAQWIGHAKGDEDLPLLRKLVRDKNSAVRLAAMKALASFSKEELLPLLRHLVKDQNWSVRAVAVRTLESRGLDFYALKEQDLLPLSQLVRDQNAVVALLWWRRWQASSQKTRPGRYFASWPWT